MVTERPLTTVIVYGSEGSTFFEDDESADEPLPAEAELQAVLKAADPITLTRLVNETWPALLLARHRY